MPRDIHPPKSNLAHDDILTTHEVAHYIKMNPSSVNKWVEEGKIKAYRTPGGHRRIQVKDLYSFLIQYGMPVPDVVSAAISMFKDEETQPQKLSTKRSKMKK